MARAKNLVMIKRPVSVIENVWEVFAKSTEKLSSRGTQGGTSCWYEFVMCRTQAVFVLKVLMDVRLYNVRGQEKSSLKVQCHWQLNAQDCKGHAKRCSTLRRFYEKQQVKVNPSCNRRSQCLERPAL